MLKALSSDGLKVGVVGLGKMGLVHAGVLSVLPNVEVAGLCEKSRLLRRFLRKIFCDVPVVGDVREFSGLDLDAVYVTTPIPSHFAVVEAVCRGKIAGSLFVEKTLAGSYGEAEELYRLAQGLRGVSMVGYLRRFGVTFGKAKNLLGENAIGKLSSFSAYAYSSDFLGEGLQSDSCRGSMLRDLGCHAVDLALWFFHDLRVKSAEVTSVDGCRDSLHFGAESSGGLEAEFDVSRCREGYRMAEVGFLIRGSKGVLETNDDRVKLRLKTGGSYTWFRHDLEDNVPFWLGLPEYYREDLYFVKSVLKRDRAEPSFYDGCKVDKIIEDVEQRVRASG